MGSSPLGAWRRALLAEAVVERLGSKLIDGGASCAVYSNVPDGGQVSVCLLAADGSVTNEFEMERGADDVWRCSVDGVRDEQRYAYRCTGPVEPSRGWFYDRTRLLLDP